MHKFDVNMRNAVPIQPVGNEGFVLASDGSVWKADVSLVKVISRRSFVSTSQVHGRVGSSGKFVIINQFPCSG
jgi:hypothetical protein